MKRFARREFIRKTASALALTSLPAISAFPAKRKKKMILSFYMDDTNPEIVKAEAYKYFLDYCYAYGIKGESSVILGYDGSSLVNGSNDNDKLYLWLAKQSYNKGIDTHMEIMTHNALFDFASGKMKNSGIHEGLWLHEPGVSVTEYQDYFSSIINEGDKAGIKFTGLTWPGCSCAECTRRYAELKTSGPLHITQPAFDALLSLAKEGRFRGRVLPVFYESRETNFGIFKRASEGQSGIYDLMPNCEDHFGIWENSEEHVDPDYYISEDGKSGIIIRHLENNAPYCMWYMHWQGLNPEKGKGWKAFETVTTRIRKHLEDKVIWMRPSDIVTSYHDAGGWNFMSS